MLDAHASAATLARARRLLSTQGYALLPEAGFTDGRTIDRTAVLGISGLFGRPSSRDGGTLIWRVQPQSTDPRETFSQRSGEALLHTDAAYHADPEPLFALFCVRPAADGGLTRLLGAADAVAGLDSETLEQLRCSMWRWVPPRVFGSQRDAARPVLGPDGTIRWRPDNLDVPEPLARVAAAFHDHVEAHPRLLQFPLPPDSVLLCDNRRVLHGRTTFTDSRRLLLRVRLWEEEEVQ